MDANGRMIAFDLGKPGSHGDAGIVLGIKIDQIIKQSKNTFYLA